MSEVIASFSGGKDSTAMVLRMIEIGDRLDEVIYCDTGLEFPAMYDHIAKVKHFVESEGIRFTTLKPEKSFEYYFLSKPVNSGAYGEYHGYGWPNMHMRWCTKHLKTEILDRYLKNRDILQCTGLAADEMRRINRHANAKHRHPLADWGWSEDVCLGYCYGRGFDWYDESVGMGLYDIFRRTSCWLCPLSNLDESRNLRKYYPDLWQRIGRMESDLKQSRQSEGLPFNTWPYKSPVSWKKLDSRFAQEDSAYTSQKVLEAFI